MAGRQRAAAWAWARRVGLLLVGAVVVEYAAVHLLPGARESWSSVGSGRPILLVLALAVELASLACFSWLSFVLLSGPDRPRYATVLAIDVTGNGFSHVVPGGGATAAALRFQLLGRAGVPRSRAVGAATLESAVTSLWLGVALLLGLIAIVPSQQTHPFLRTAAVLAVVVILVFGGLVAVLMARPDQLVAVTHAVAGRLPVVRPETLERVVRAVGEQVHAVLDTRSRLRSSIAWALGNWGFDAVCLYLSVWAFGPAPDPGGLLTTYALVCLLALLPVTPGGLGVVEGVAVPVLVSFGTAHGAALLGVLTWRLFEFWLPIPLALASYLWLRTDPVRGAT